MTMKVINRVEEAHEDAILTAAWVPQEELLLTGSADGTLNLWRCENERIIAEIVSGTGSSAVCSVAVHNSGKFAVSASASKGFSMVSEFDVRANPVFKCLPISFSTDYPISTEAFFQLKFSPDGDILAVAAGGSVRLYKTSTLEQSMILKLPRERDIPTEIIISISWNLNGKRLACGCINGRVVVFDIEHGKYLHDLQRHFSVGSVTSLVYSPVSYSILFTTCNGRGLFVHDDRCGTKAIQKTFVDDPATSIDASPDGDSVVTGHYVGVVQLWDMKKMDSPQQIFDNNHQMQVWAVAFHPDSDSPKLASVSEDQIIAFYDQQ